MLDNRRIINPDIKLKIGQEVRVHLSEGGERDPLETGKSFSPDKARILYSDNDLIAFDKASGIPSQATQTSTASLSDIVRETAGCRVFPVHRLDLETSGITVFGKSRKASSKLMEFFRLRKVHKTYVAISSGEPSVHKNEPEILSSGTFNWNLGKDPAGRGRWRVLNNGGISAITHWRQLYFSGKEIIPGGFSLLKLEPETGRTHQIRVHLKHAGSPVLGDKRYGAPDFITLADGKRIEINRTMLHAFHLSIPHPAGIKKLDIMAPLPPDMLELLKELGLQDHRLNLHEIIKLKKCRAAENIG